MPKVQKPLPGLAAFLGIETQGLLRMEALQSVQPTIEVEDYLGPNQFAQLQDTAVPQDGLIEIEVPNNRFWRLKWVSMTVDTSALVFANGIINLVPAESGLSYQLSPPFIGYSGAASNPAYMFGLSSASGFGVDVKGVNARPGDKIQAQLVQTSDVGNNTVRLFVQYQELKI